GPPTGVGPRGQPDAGNGGAGPGRGGRLCRGGTGRLRRGGDEDGNGAPKRRQRNGVGGPDRAGAGRPGRGAAGGGGADRRERRVTVHRELDERLARARLGGSEAARHKQKAAGRLRVRERLALLLDEELGCEDGLLARCEEDLAADAVVTGVGRVDGRPVAVIDNDFTVKAGTWGRRTFEKITLLQERADKVGIPVVYLVDAAGARIDEQFDSYAGRHAWGNIFTNLVRFSGRVPQVCVLFGPSPAGSAYVPALCDVVIMVRGHATAYLGSPRLAEMVTGERVTMEEMGGAEMHCSVSGLGDVLVDDDAEAIAAVRVWLSYLPSSWR